MFNESNLQFRKLLKLQLGVIGISDIGWVKPKIPLPDHEKKSEGWMPAKIPRQKWSISYLWEHFLVPDHRIPIWLVGRLADWLIGSLAHWLTHQNHWNSLGFINILKFDIERTHQNHWNSLGFINILKLDIERTHQNHWNSIGFSDILQTWKYQEFTKPLFL